MAWQMQGKGWPGMRARRQIEDLDGVAAGPRRHAVRVSLSEPEYAVVAEVADEQGWSVGGWIGAMLECVELVAAVPGGWVDAHAWSQAARLAWSMGMGGQWMTIAGETPAVVERGRELRATALLAERVWRAQAAGARVRGTEDNGAAARFAELVALEVGPGWRSCGGTGRRRVKVGISERTWVILDRGVTQLGWSASDWVGTVAVAAAGWLASGAVGEAGLLDATLGQLGVAHARIGDVVPAPGVDPPAPEVLIRAAVDATGALSRAQAALLEVGATVTRSRDRRRVEVAAVEKLVGWPGTQMTLNVGAGIHDGIR